MNTKTRMTLFKPTMSTRHRDGGYTVVVMGAEDVGKTALVVRFLTKKYLPEYSHSGTVCYERNIVLDGKPTTVRVLDTSGRDTLTGLKGLGVLDGADGYVVVYSVTDKRSFNKAREMMRMINTIDKRSPVALIGNKEDLVHLRTVSGADGQREGLTYPRCTFHECSAAREAENVETAFHAFFRQVVQSKEEKRQVSTLSVKLPNPRRNSAGNSTLSGWWRRPRFNSTRSRSTRQTRTFTM